MFFKNMECSSLHFYSQTDSGTAIFLWILIHLFQRGKNINVMCKDLVSCLTRKKIDQWNCVFQKSPFSFGILFYENDIEKLIFSFLLPINLVDNRSLLFLNMFYREFWTRWVLRINMLQQVFTEHFGESGGQ